MFRVNVGGGAKLNGLARDLRRAGGRLRPTLTKELREPTKGVHDAVRRDILTAELPGRPYAGRKRRFPRRWGGETPLRRPTAAAVDWKVSTSAGGARADVTFDPNRIPAHKRGLFAYWVGQKRRLRHPVMGNWTVWVGQQIPDVWRQTRRLAPLAQKAAGKALDKTAAIINGKR